MNKILNCFTFFLYALLLSFLFSCHSQPASIDNSLEKYFIEKNVDGCFTLFSNGTGQITVYNMEMDTLRFSPASTFKIVNSLIGLQNGAITNDSMVIKWDGQKRNANWDHDMNMIEAFRVSCVPYYQEVARRIGKDTMHKWVDSIGYGNKNISGPIDSFWLNGQLKISPDEQLGLVKRLYFLQLPFRKSVQENVKQVMLRESNTAYKLSYKTGLGLDNGKAIAWVVGWIEENQHPYFFVTLVKGRNPIDDLVTIRMDITSNILKHLGFLEGKK